MRPTTLPLLERAVEFLHQVETMLDFLTALSGTSIPDVLMGLGGLLFLLAWIERRAATIIGSLLFFLGVGVWVAPQVAQVPDRPSPPTAYSSPLDPALIDPHRRLGRPCTPRQRTGQLRIPRLQSAPTAMRRLTRSNGQSRAPTSPRVLRPVARHGLRTSKSTGPQILKGRRLSIGMEEPSYGGLLGNLMPCPRLLPCATRRSNSRPLTPRSVAQDSGRPEATAHRILTERGFAGVERTFGTSALVPLATAKSRSLASEF